MENKETKKTKRNWKRIFMLGCLGLLILSICITVMSLVGIAYFNGRELNLGGTSEDIESPGRRNNPSPTPTVESKDPIYTGKDLIFFRRLNVRSDYSDDELWVMESDGSNAKSLGIVDVQEVFNGPNKKWVAFKRYSDSASLYLLDLSNGDVKEINALEGKGEKIDAYIQGNTTVSISPDESHIAYTVTYLSTENCGLEGICPEYDGYPEVKQGYVSYNLDTGKEVYLGNFNIIGNWSADSRFVFSSSGNNYEDFVYGDQAVKVNVETGDYQLLDSKGSSLENIFYLSNDTKLTLTAEEPVKYILNKNGVNKKIDEGEFAELQPVFWNTISPNHKYAIYSRKVSNNNGQPIFKLVLIDFDKATASDLVTPKDNKTAIVHDGYWINNKSFYYTKSIDINWNNYNNTELNTDIYIVDVTTGKEVKLTDYSDVDLW